METTESIRKRIEHHFNELSPAERRVARVMLVNYPLSGLETIATISQKANVSDPTVLRFVAKLGYKRYIDFQTAVKQELDERMQGPLNVQTNGAASKTDLQSYLGKFKSTIINNIEETFQGITDTEFEGVLKVLMDTKKQIHLVGGQFTDSIARYLYFHLRKMRPQVHLIQGQGPSRIDHLLDLGKKDALIVFDVRRYQPDIVEFAARASDKVGSLILITDQWLSPAAKYARFVLPCCVSSVSRWDSLVGMTALIEALMSYFAEQHWPEIKPRLSSLEKIRDGINSSQYLD
jgi:DNA-binding MurR/RpiR family transcriptional regulator